MAWNDNNNQNPWGGNGQTPPELDQVIKDFKNKFGSIFGGKQSSNSDTPNLPSTGGLKYVFILALLVWVLSGIYIIDPAEKGVVLRFGDFPRRDRSRPALAPAVSN
jgi:protease FtsH subunit HflK